MIANFDVPPRGFRVTAGEDGAWTVRYRTTGMGGAALFFAVWLGIWTGGCLFFTGAALFEPGGVNYAVLLFMVPFWGAEFFVVGFVAWYFLSVTRFTFGPDELVVERSLLWWHNRQSFPWRSVTAVK